MCWQGGGQRCKEARTPCVRDVDIDNVKTRAAAAPATVRRRVTSTDAPRFAPTQLAGSPTRRVILGSSSPGALSNVTYRRHALAIQRQPSPNIRPPLLIVH